MPNCAAAKPPKFGERDPLTACCCLLLSTAAPAASQLARRFSTLAKSSASARLTRAVGLGASGLIAGGACRAPGQSLAPRNTPSWQRTICALAGASTTTAEPIRQLSSNALTLSVPLSIMGHTSLMSRSVRGQRVYARPHFGACASRSGENLVNALQSYGEREACLRKRSLTGARLKRNVIPREH